MRLCLARGKSPASHPFPTMGDRVRVVSGALEGLKGVVIRNKNNCRIIVSIHLIHQSVSVEIDAELLEPLADFATMSGNVKAHDARV